MEYTWTQPRRCHPGSECSPSEEIPWRATQAGLWMDGELVGFPEAGREILRLAEENERLRVALDLFAKGPEALEAAVVARIRREWLAEIEAIADVVQLSEDGEEPEPVEMCGKEDLLDALDRICGKEE